MDEYLYCVFQELIFLFIHYVIFTLADHVNVTIRLSVIYLGCAFTSKGLKVKKSYFTPSFQETKITLYKKYEEKCFIFLLFSMLIHKMLAAPYLQNKLESCNVNVAITRRNSESE
jgi:hypothetical protein